MNTRVKFDLLRGWASALAKKYSTQGQVEVKEPTFPNGAVTVDIDLDRTLAQVLLWSSGMLELRVVAVESGEEVTTENHQVQDEDELAEVLRRVEALVAATDAAP